MQADRARRKHVIADYCVGIMTRRNIVSHPHTHTHTSVGHLNGLSLDTDNYDLSITCTNFVENPVLPLGSFNRNLEQRVGFLLRIPVDRNNERLSIPNGRPSVTIASERRRQLPSLSVSNNGVYLHGGPSDSFRARPRLFFLSIFYSIYFFYQRRGAVTI